MQSHQRLTLAFWLLLLTCIWLLAACGNSSDFDQPPEIRYGEDICARCSMIINEARYAAAYVTAEGEVRLFDDIGGMFDYNAQMNEEVAVFWVHDFDTEQWLKADQAYYVEGDHITPMGYGIVAFGDESRAGDWAAENEGMIVTFDSLLAGMEAMNHSDS